MISVLNNRELDACKDYGVSKSGMDKEVVEVVEFTDWKPKEDVGLPWRDVVEVTKRRMVKCQELTRPGDSLYWILKLAPCHKFCHSIFGNVP